VQLHLFAPLLIGGIAFVVGLIVRSQEPPGSWLRRHGIPKILVIATTLALLALLFSLPAVTMSEPT
jgi:hypothetical protein